MLGARKDGGIIAVQTLEGRFSISTEVGDTLRLTVRVTRDEEEQCFLADCLELDISSFGDTAEEALDMVRDAIDAFLNAASISELEERLHAYEVSKKSEPIVLFALIEFGHTPPGSSQAFQFMQTERLELRAA